MFCSRCGIRVEEGNRFCQACGQEVGAAVVTAPSGTVYSGPVVASARASTQLQYGGFWLRFAASLVDGLILGIPMGAVALVLIFLFGGFGVLIHMHPGDPGAARAFAATMIPILFLVMLVFVILQWLYFASMESSPRQATFGKSILSLRVANLDGQRISFGHATGRFFAKFVTGMIPFAIGYLMAGFTAKKQALHDFIAGTLVLRK